MTVCGRPARSIDLAIVSVNHLHKRFLVLAFPLPHHILLPVLDINTLGGDGRKLAALQVVDGACGFVIRLLDNSISYSRQQIILNVFLGQQIIL